MIRDAERYALVNLELINKIQFTLINLKVNKNRKVSVKNKELSCNCFDFKIRCKKSQVICKHICYVLDRILKYDLKRIKKLKI